jgi:hypothetical protein
MRSRGIWAVTLLVTLLLVAPSLTACQAARAVTHAPTATAQSTGHSIVVWTSYSSNGAIQVWIATADDQPRLLATPTTSFDQCPTVAAGLPMVSPDGTHILLSLGQRCDLILDPGPLVIIDVATGHAITVSLPQGGTVLPQVRSYGWVNNRTVFAFSQYNYTDVYHTYLYTLGTGQATTLAGVDQALEGVVRGTTLFYLEVTSGHGGTLSILRRYDLARNMAIAGGIDMGAYNGACSECPDQVISPGWDVAADGAHVVFQRTTPRSTGGIASSKILYARADGSDAASIAQALATDTMIHLRLSPDGKRVAITGAYPFPSSVVTACVDTPGTRGDPCLATYSPNAVSLAAWSPDGQSFLAATQDASYGRPLNETKSLVRYTLGSATGQPIAVAYSPWSAP